MQLSWQAWVAEKNRQTSKTRVQRPMSAQPKTKHTEQQNVRAYHAWCAAKDREARQRRRREAVRIATLGAVWTQHCFVAYMACGFAVWQAAREILLRKRDAVKARQRSLAVVRHCAHTRGGHAQLTCCHCGCAGVSPCRQDDVPSPCEAQHGTWPQTRLPSPQEQSPLPRPLPRWCSRTSTPTTASGG